MHSSLEVLGGHLLHHGVINRRARQGCCVVTLGAEDGSLSLLDAGRADADLWGRLVVEEVAEVGLARARGSNSQTRRDLRVDVAMVQCLVELLEHGCQGERGEGRGG